ncbi:class F sortase [Streptomyces sp. URMC 126]|uniref:class F sortase n=1 Tax=Streptomyces sp. URMC 126 TaxID=3423401 RepID=UPI003F1B25E4
MPGLLARTVLCLAGALGLALAPAVVTPGMGLEGGHPAHGRAVAGSTGASSPPVAVEIPGRFRAEVVPVAADPGGALELPRSPGTVGWWALGARPGAPEGTVLLAGHVDTREYGLGVFAELRDVPLGTRAVITDAEGHPHSYLITERRSYPKEALPPRLFTDRGPARLALVTCAGTYDRQRHRYTRNLVLLGDALPDGR